MILSIEIYQDGDNHCAYLTDNCGGSGIEVKETEYDRFANEIGRYIADYAFNEGTNEEEEVEE